MPKPRNQSTALFRPWLPDNSEAGERLEAFSQMLERWNSAYNLVSRRDLHRLRTRHICDSLAALPCLSGDRIADLGSGAGLPGLPLAIADPERSFTLIERSERRVRFLRQVQMELDLNNVKIVAEPAEAVSDQFDVVTARAVAPVAEVLALAAPLLRPEGVLLVFGRVEDVLQNAHIEVAREYRIPDIDEPHILTRVLPGLPPNQDTRG